jgi:uncharacterized protein YecE (DUF72 family)
MVKKSEAKVRFTVKVHQSLTHTRDADEATLERLFASVQPLREAGVLGPFLAQFPYSFHRTPENRLYLKNLVERFKEANETLAVEFRNAAWHVPEVVQAFEELGLVMVSVDYPQVGRMPKPELYLTSDIVYLRLHGRNEEKWYGGKDASERHDYLYTPDELKPWVLGLAERRDEIREAYVLFQNTTKGHALKNLEMLKVLFDEVGLDAPIAP